MFFYDFFIYSFIHTFIHKFMYVVRTKNLLSCCNSSEYLCLPPNILLIKCHGISCLMVLFLLFSSSQNNLRFLSDCIISNDTPFIKTLAHFHYLFHFFLAVNMCVFCSRITSFHFVLLCCFHVLYHVLFVIFKFKKLATITSHFP